MSERLTAEALSVGLMSIAYRMTCRVDGCLERAAGDVKRATESPGPGISFRFARDIARTCEQAAEMLREDETPIEERWVLCEECDGKGRLHEYRSLDVCQVCDGEGVIQVTTQLVDQEDLEAVGE